MNFCLQFYIDPVNGNALRSIRDVHRYLTTGKVSKLAYKSRNQRNSDVEFQHDDISVSALKVLEVYITKFFDEVIVEQISLLLWSDSDRNRLY